jgi:hypothetical protein
MATQRTTTSTWLALGVAAVLLLYVTAGRGLHGLTGVVAAIGVVVLVTYALLPARFGSRGDTAPTASTAPSSAPSAASSAKSAQSDAESLNVINLRVRSAGLALDLVQRIERLIDQLADLLPTLSGQFAGFELTWQMQQIASAYLPKLVDAYASLGEAERSQRRSDFETSLAELEDAAARTTRALREQRTTEFENISAFLKLRFS